MPHLVILYTAQLDAETDMRMLCRQLADTMLTVVDETGRPVFPAGGTRVLAYPAAHYAIADGGSAGRAAGLPGGGGGGGDAAAGDIDPGDYAFVYLNLRMARGRSEAAKRQAGEALSAVAAAFFEPLKRRRWIGITLQIDEGMEVFDSKNSNLHPLFAKPG